LRALLIKWSESILDIPVLVLQGYGGVTNPVVEHEGDDVSSWGEEGEPPQVGDADADDDDDDDDDDQPLMTQVETLQEHVEKVRTRANTRRGSLQGSTATDEDRVIIQKLGEIAPSPGAHRTVRKMPRSAARAMNGIHGDDDNDDDDDMDLEPLSTQAPEAMLIPLMTQALEPTQEDGGYVGGEAASAKKAVDKAEDAVTDEAKQATRSSPGKIPERKELVNATDEIFKEITDTDSVTVVDVLKSLSERYGFELGRAQRRLVMARLTDLMSAKTSTPLAAIANAHNTPPTSAAAAADQSAVEIAIATDSDKANGEENGEENDSKPAAKTRGAKRGFELKHIKWPTDSSDSEAEYISPSRSFKRARAAAKPNRAASPGGTITRVRFSEDEVAALREGIEKYGIGKWQKIIDNCNGRLESRSGVQVKDKYRNMIKSGQIERPESEPE
jgi:hypothetical protein